MKDIVKIIRHYLLISIATTLILLFINCIILVYWLHSSTQSANFKYNIERLSQQLIKTDEGYTLSTNGRNMLQKYYVWAMLLDDYGHVIWSENLPSEIKLHYTSSEIAGFSTWYLKDYPVRVWANDYGLLVAAQPKHSLWKFQLEAPEKMLRSLPSLFIFVLICNILVSIFICLLLGLRFFHSLKKIISGIEDLTTKKPVTLQTKGILKPLANNINMVSNELIRQQNLIKKRDTARNNWIAGVSHDIRTPLSMIMGYSSTLENDPHFSVEDRKQFGIIRVQSERIKSLVDDLNLTVRLEYEMQPLNIKPFYLSKLLRETVVDYLNTLDFDQYALELNISDSCQDFKINGDMMLFKRALHNIINNCIKHNPDGTEIFITLNLENEHYTLEIKDTGTGFDQSTLEKLNTTSQMPTGIDHGLGLFIVKQIAQVSGAQISFTNWHKGSCITFIF